MRKSTHGYIYDQQSYLRSSRTNDASPKTTGVQYTWTEHSYSRDIVIRKRIPIPFVDHNYCWTEVNSGLRA